MVSTKYYSTKKIDSYFQGISITCLFQGVYWEFLTYFMSKKSWPDLYSNLLHKMGQDFLDIQSCNIMQDLFPRFM